MSAKSLLVSTLSKTGLEVVPYPYRGDNTRYYTYLIEDAAASQYGNNKALKETIYFQIQLCAPEDFNTKTFRKRTCELLEEAGFSYPRMEEIKDISVKRQRLIFQTHITLRR